VSIAPKQELIRKGESSEVQPFHGVFTRVSAINVHSLIHCGDTEHFRLVKRRRFFTDHERHFHWKASRVRFSLSLSLSLSLFEYIYIYTCVYICVCLCVFVCLRAYMYYIWMSVYVCMCVHLFVSVVCVCRYVCLFRVYFCLQLFSWLFMNAFCFARPLYPLSDL
jgi:hypothetical protein